MAKVGHTMNREELKNAVNVPRFSAPRKRESVADSPEKVEGLENTAARRVNLINNPISLSIHSISSDCIVSLNKKNLVIIIRLTKLLYRRCTR